MRVMAVLSDLTGRSTRRIIAILREQVWHGLAGAELARDVSLGGRSVESARTQMSSIEHDGDAARARLVRALTRTVVTPVDREDLFRISRSIDDVLDSLRDLVRQLDLFDVQPREVSGPLGSVVDTLHVLDRAIGSLATPTRQAGTDVLAIRKASNQIRLGVLEGTAAALAQGLTVESLYRVELFRRIEKVDSHIRAVADALADAYIKRGH